MTYMQKATEAITAKFVTGELSLEEASEQIKRAKSLLLELAKVTPHDPGLADLVRERDA